MRTDRERSLIGRADHAGRLTSLLGAARRGAGGALVLRGEAGIGKSALLAYAEEAATGFRVVRAAGAEFEMELPFAALHQVCTPALGHLPALPEPHRAALEIAFGLGAGTPDPFLVGIATLGLLTEYARQAPLLCVIDDAQWLDRSSAKSLAFLARRIAAEPVAVLFAVRDPGLPEIDRLPGVTVERLGDADARALLAAEVGAPLCEQVRDRILAEARGNPLALVELPRSVGAAGLAGGFAPPDAAPVAGRIERSFRTRTEQLAAPVRRLVTLAAAEPTGDLDLLWRAAALLDLDRGTAQDAASSGLVEFGVRVRFCHPLARSAVYRAAGADERRAAHRALAAAIDPVADPDRRAWHRAQATGGPDEEVAAELEDSARRARARGGAAAEAAFLKRSAELSLDPGRRADRVLAAAQAAFDIGVFESAEELLTFLPADAWNGCRSARLDALRGRISFARHRGGDGALAYLLQAARRLAGADPRGSRAYYLDALEAGILIGGVDVVAAAAGAAPPAPGPPWNADLVLDGLVCLVTGDRRAAAGTLGPIVAAHDDEVWGRRPSLGFLLAAELWDFDALAGIARRTVRTGRESGSRHILPIGLAMAAVAAAHGGDFGAATELISEGEAISEATGAAPLPYPRLHLAALRGRRQEATDLFDAVGVRDQRMSLSLQWAGAVLHNGLGEYAAALDAARQAVAHDDLGLTGLALPELVEAAIRCGRPDLATPALIALSERADAGGARWGLGVAAYARALVTDDEHDYREAIEHLDGSGALVYRGRAHLLYGEWLRRQGRRRDARQALRHAHGLLSGCRAEAFAERAARELRATGEHARSRSPQADSALTFQELHIARLVADGATSKEVAAQLFLSPRTVDAHLRNIFKKLGITSRRQLRDFPDLS